MSVYDCFIRGHEQGRIFKIKDDELIEYKKCITCGQETKHRTYQAVEADGQVVMKLRKTQWASRILKD